MSQAEEDVKLPLGDQAAVPLTKITEYLLNEAHPQGRAKAAFFRRLGYHPGRPEQLQEAMLELARTSDVAETTFRFGRKYVGTGTLHAPSGRRVRIVTVWVLLANAPPPIPVTAYPA